MGTNYYLVETHPCPLCGNGPSPENRLHLGKKSRGWDFTLRGYPDACLDSWQAIRSFVTASIARGAAICTEYGHLIDLEEFVEIVTDKGGRRHGCGFYDNESYLDGEGFSISPYEFS